MGKRRAFLEMISKKLDDKWHRVIVGSKHAHQTRMIGGWVSESLEGDWCNFRQDFWFEKEEDAVFFKLTWS